MVHDHDDLLWRPDAVTWVCRERSSVSSGRRTETVSLDDIAGRTVAEPISAEVDVPPADYATMDEYAIDATADYPLAVVDTDVFPEDEPPEIDSNEAIPIATGDSFRRVQTRFSNGKK